MEHSKEFYQRLVKVIEYLLNVDRSIDNDKGKEIAGENWGDIIDFFRNHRGVYFFSHNYIGVKDREKLISLLAECKSKIADIDKSEYDRELANLESRENIKYGRKGYRIAIAALVISLLALGLEIVKWLQGQ